MEIKLNKSYRMRAVGIYAEIKRHIANCFLLQKVMDICKKM